MTFISLFSYLLCLKIGLICLTYENFYQFLFYSSKLILISVEITALALSLALSAFHRDIFFFLILILVFVYGILVRALWLLWDFHSQKNPIPRRIAHGTSEKFILIIIFLILVLSQPFGGLEPLVIPESWIAFCDRRNSSPPLAFYGTPPAQPQPDVPGGEPIQFQQAVPDIPRIDPPLISDSDRFQQLYRQFLIYRINRTEIRDLAEFAGQLERAVRIEGHIEAALRQDGYQPDFLAFRRNQIRSILFTHPTRALLLREQTLDSYINQIETSGTRQSVPYQRVVSAIRRNELLL